MASSGSSSSVSWSACAPSPESTAEPTAEPEPTPTPTVEVAPIGEAALPLGCADLLDVSDVAGTLRCTWSARYGSTDFHGSVEVRVAPTTATSLDPAAEESYFGPLASHDGDADTLLVCDGGFQADDTGLLYNNCEIVRLQAPYRIEVRTLGLRAEAPEGSSVALGLLAKVGSAVDAAPPARVIQSAGGTPDPASVCRAPEVTPLLERLGAVGEPVVSPSAAYPGVTTCVWPGVDEYGNESGPWVSVLPGGAWAIPRLQGGHASIFLPTHPSADGSYLVGVGDGVSAWRAVGDDLVYVLSGDFEATEGWEAFLESIW